MAQHGRKPVLTIPATEAADLLPHIEQACRAIRCIVAMHSAARLSNQAKQMRATGRKLAALQRRLDALAAGSSESRENSRSALKDRPARSANGALHEPLIVPATAATAATAGAA